jgi:CheY-like chemotaxis protein
MGRAREDDGPAALLVDDDPALRRLVARMLSGAGYSVLEAPDGQSGLAASACVGKPVELLVTDVCMPGMSGWELAELLGSRWPGMKTVVISGAEMEPSQRPRPGVAFLRKPFTAETLLDRVARLRDGG